MAKRTPTTLDQYWHKGGVCGLVSRAAFRTLQFVFAITVAGLYGVDLAYATRTNNTAPTEWVYAEFVAAVSAITCIVHCFVTVVHVAWSAWDGIVFVLWLAQVGVFGTLYSSSVKNKYYQNATLSVPRMRAAVWIDLLNMLLWFATFVLGIAWCCRTRKVTRRVDPCDDAEVALTADVLEQSALDGYKKEAEDLASKHIVEKRVDEANPKALEVELEKQRTDDEDIRKGRVG
ncbi:hypothetical protein N7494_004153 [Penicillium frequentans]|uniref:MARVEL domain-containing protein n=1 Tax=Penicillium frequentans TaxID=3151616 RepID=A0AAD6GIM8_9EURO|nr:hypothetical protein N7494_004153 [Penicillium glabrum]